jgi:DNA (cytosine-5)-methyltransferase 1
MFVGENVKGLLTMGNGSIIDAIVAEFADCGYDVFYKLLNARDYGVPEDRERVIIVGFRKDLNIHDFEFPHPRPYKVTMREALKNIPEGAVTGQKYQYRLTGSLRNRLPQPV